MTVSFRKRPYRLGKLLTSLGSINPENNEAVWERSSGEQAAKFYKQHSIQSGELEHSSFHPHPRHGARLAVRHCIRWR